MYSNVSKKKVVFAYIGLINLYVKPDNHGYVGIGSLLFTEQSTRAGKHKS